MKIARAYKDMTPTYGELATALKKLKFVDKSTSAAFVYVHEATDSIVLLPLKAENENVLVDHFASLSYILEGRGVIDHQYDIGKMIEKARLQEQRAAA